MGIPRTLISVFFPSSAHEHAQRAYTYQWRRRPVELRTCTYARMVGHVTRKCHHTTESAIFFFIFRFLPSSPCLTPLLPWKRVGDKTKSQCPPTAPCILCIRIRWTGGITIIIIIIIAEEPLILGNTTPVGRKKKRLGFNIYRVVFFLVSTIIIIIIHLYRSPYNNISLY